MKSIRIKKGFDLKIGGSPEKSIMSIENPSCVAMLPAKIPFVKPKLLVKPGDKVKIGTPVFEDKKNPLIKFLSPGGGVIEKINFGKRRAIREIIIKLDEEEKRENFKVFSDDEIENTERKQLISALLEGGLWPFIRQLPFRDIADPELVCASIFVRIGNMEPFHPLPDVCLANKNNLFYYGLKVLEKLSAKVFVYSSDRNKTILKDFKACITHTVSGKYPADDPGVMLFHTKKSADENLAWYLNFQDLCLIAFFLKNGEYPVERIICVGGPAAEKTMHIKTRAGVPISHILPLSENKKKIRYISGGIFSGNTTDLSSFMGFYETSLTLLDKGDNEEFFGFIRPGIHKQGYSKTFLSVFAQTPFKIDCGKHGEERACVNCSSCFYVCPVDILAQFAMKAVLCGEIDEALSYGLLDCVECGLCSYVCPSKIELSSILKQARQAVTE